MVVFPYTYKDKTMRLLAILGVMVLAGCATGIQPGGEYPSQTFMVPIGYEEAYRRADAQARTCMPDVLTTGNLYADNKTGVVRLSSGGFSSGEQMNTKVEQMDAGTRVTVTAWGVGGFDERQIAAVRKSVETGITTCR